MTTNEMDWFQNPSLKLQFEIGAKLFQGGYDAAKEGVLKEQEHDCTKSPEDGCVVCDVE